jgi:hypothetical protein
VSLGISAVLHLLLIILYPALLIRAPSFSPQFGTTGQPVNPHGTELVNLEEIPDEPPDEAPPPEEEPEPEPIQAAAPVEAEGAGAGDVGGEEGVRGPTAAELLRPQAGDLRLWAPVNPEIVALSDQDIMRLLLLAELEEVIDSAALADELARRSMDWTYTDDDGKRWGVSPGKIHLGDITIPMPFSFGSSPMVREQNANQIWAWQDVERAAGRKGVQDYWKERAEAIRRRKDAERRPDTTGIRR